MVESYTVAARLEMTSNAAQVTAQVMAEFGRLNREIKATQENLGRFTTDMRALAGAGRGMGALTAAMEKLGKAKLGGGIMADMDRLTAATRGLETVQATLTRDAQAMATAYREAAAAARSMGGGAGGGGRRGGSGGAPGTWPQAWRDAYPNAQYDNSNVNHVARAGEAAAAGRFRNDFALATHENAARDAAARRGRASQADMLSGAMGAQQVGGEGLSFFTKAIMAEAEVAQQLAGLRMNSKITDKDVADARSAAERIARQTPGTTIADNLHHIVDLFTVMGDVKEALAGAPAFAQAAYVIKNLPGAHHGDESFAAAQAVEVMQRFYDKTTHQVNVEAFNQQMAAMVQVAAGTGGRVEGNAYLGFAKSSRVGGMAANDQFLYRDLPAMLVSMGGSRVGTGEAATFQQFITGRMTEKAANELKAAGLLDKTAVYKGGAVGDMQHKFHGFEMFGTNPVEWVRNYMLGAEGALQRNKVNPNDVLAVSKFLSDWSSRQTGLGFMAEMTLGMGGINKESQKIGQSGNVMQVMQQNDPMQKMREFRAAENELMVTLGQNAIGPAMEALRGLTSVLRQLSDIGKSHPNLAGDITLIVGGVSALATAAGNAAMVLFVGAPIVTGLRALTGALSPFSAGGAAAGAMASLPAGLSGVGIALVALAGAVVGIPKIFEGLAGALGLHGGQTLHGGGKGDRSGIMPDASGASPWGGLGSLFGGPSTPSPSTQGGPHTGGGRGSGTHFSPSSYYARPVPAPVIQATFINQIDGREVSRSVSYHQSRELSGPARGTTGYDLRETPMMPGAGAVAI